MAAEAASFSTEMVAISFGFRKLMSFTGRPSTT